MRNIAIFASGNGSNMQALHDKIKQGILNANYALFVSDKPESNAAKYARDNNIPSFVFTPKAYENKTHYEEAILTQLKEYNVDLIILAGYMRYVGMTLLDAYPNRILNIHPSLLPDFKGKDAIKQAFEAHVKETGVTVHYVDEKIDHGDVIMQERCEINRIDTLQTLTQKIHQIEHKLYAEAIQKVLEEAHEKSVD